MKKKKLLHKLGEFLDMKGRKQRKHQDDLEELLVKLKRKMDDLEKQRQQEKNSRKKKRLDNELEILAAQHAKGSKTLQELTTP